MIDGSLKSVLDNKKISKALIDNSVEKLNGNKRLYIFSDHCDSRKPYSSKLENLGKVRDLNSNIINGFTTLGSVILDENMKELTLSNISVQSNREPTFITKKELKDYNDGKIKNKQRVKEINKLIEQDNYHTMSSLLYKHLKEQSDALKQENPKLSICHVHDRGCDSVEYLEFIKETLGDDAVVRAKKSRNSEQTKINQQTNRKVKVKLIESEFAYKKVYLIDKLTLKGRDYQQVKCHIEWDSITLNAKEYSVVRVTLVKRDGKPIYKEPMLLISTLKIDSYLDAKEIYHIYLHRAKIEGVFKFLKDVLGWEEYQVRDWESIKNIISICYFIGGYFYEIQSTLIEDETVQMICNLAKNKGVISRHFFLEGL
ncbi:MAG: transposase, partial [Campylobacterota bacterium]|nr:transposase [Campylobacterota bacterium]